LAVTVTGIGGPDAKAEYRNDGAEHDFHDLSPGLPALCRSGLRRQSASKTLFQNRSQRQPPCEMAGGRLPLLSASLLSYDCERIVGNPYFPLNGVGSCGRSKAHETFAFGETGYYPSTPVASAHAQAVNLREQAR
jgi:hypothetical protein